MYNGNRRHKDVSYIFRTGIVHNGGDRTVLSLHRDIGTGKRRGQRTKNKYEKPGSDEGDINDKNLAVIYCCDYRHHAPIYLPLSFTFINI